MTKDNSVSVKFLFSHPAHFIALGAGSGLSPIAPGTFGTLFAWLSFVVVYYANLFSTSNTTYYILWVAVFILVVTLISWWACKLTAERLNISDPSAVVCDEIVAFWLVLFIAILGAWWVQIVAFVIFRFFDAVKFGLVKWADNKFKGFGWYGAWGIMFDDFIAAAMTLIFIVPLVYFTY